METSALKNPDTDLMHRHCLQVQQLVGLLIEANESTPIAAHTCGIGWLLTDAYDRLGCLADAILDIGNHYLIHQDNIDKTKIEVLKVESPPAY
jgi:hypothetical protein